MNRIDQKFQEDKKLLSIYFSAGYPSLEDTVPILKNLQATGVDMVEIGLPFSDPLADCLLYTSPSPRDQRGSRMPSSA